MAETTGCTDAPAGVLHLRDVLRQIESQEFGKGDCRPLAGCYLPPDPGPCFGAIPRFAYDPLTGACKQFTYGGCGGNANLFETKAACEEACDFDPCLSASPDTAPTEAGPTTCSNITIPVARRCSGDLGVACGCACSWAGLDATECKFSVGKPGFQDSVWCP